MNPQPMCWQVVVFTSIVSAITGFLTYTVLTTSGWSFKEQMILIITIVIGMGIIVAIGTGAKWFLDAVLSKLPIKTQEAPK